MISVAIGMALHTKKERHLVYQGECTWLNPLQWITYLILVPCNHFFVFPSFIELRCTRTHLGKGIDNTYLTTHELLTQLYSTLAPHDFYLKIDPDTLIVPSNLYHFLTDQSSVQYFGSDEISRKHVRIMNKTFNYAHGGIEGFSYRTLQMLVNDMCVENVGNLSCSKVYCLNKLEDVAVGACASLHNRVFTYHSCFSAWGPCNVYTPGADCKCRLCRRTISIHKLKNPAWYRLWWALLDNQTFMEGALRPPLTKVIARST